MPLDHILKEDMKADQSLQITIACPLLWQIMHVGCGAMESSSTFLFNHL